MLFKLDVGAKLESSNDSTVVVVPDNAAVELMASINGWAGYTMEPSAGSYSVRVKADGVHHFKVPPALRSPLYFMSTLHASFFFSIALTERGALLALSRLPSVYCFVLATGSRIVHVPRMQKFFKNHQLDLRNEAREHAQSAAESGRGDEVSSQGALCCSVA